MRPAVKYSVAAVSGGIFYALAVFLAQLELFFGTFTGFFDFVRAFILVPLFLFGAVLQPVYDLVEGPNATFVDGPSPYFGYAVVFLTGALLAVLLVWSVNYVKLHPKKAWRVYFGLGIYLFFVGIFVMNFSI